MRNTNEMRLLSLETGVQIHADGSCLIKQGNTHVLCSASIEDRVPGWMKGKGRGWITSEYGMLPRSTHTRSDREAAKGKQGGRTVEIQRLIGRSLRQAVNLEALGERQITLDCDVVNADGGTRCASITGAWVALALALKSRDLMGALVRQVAAVSVGILEAQAPDLRSGLILDLEYEEDHQAAVDSNLVAARGYLDEGDRAVATLPLRPPHAPHPLTGPSPASRSGLSDLSIVEFQSTGEGRSFSRAEALGLVDMGLEGCAALMAAQLLALA